MTNKNDKDQMGVEIKNEIAEGSYSNIAIITHSSNEFVVDFAVMLPGFQAPHVTNRIIMAPENAKKLLIALKDNISKYEKSNGTIVSPDIVSDKFQIGGGKNGAKS